MLLVLDDDHREDLALLKDFAPQIVNEFCKIAVNFLQSGSNKRLFVGAAQKLGYEVATVEHCVQGLSYLFALSSKTNVSEKDFTDSLITLDFTPEVNDMLKEHYFSNRADIRRILSKSSFSLPRYKNLHWRLDIQVASRSNHNDVKPVFTLALETEEDEQRKTEYLQVDYMNLKHMCTQLEAALKEARSGHTRRMMRNIK
ncbi:COMM domain-containing protein 2 [Balamuthia mandrillaris]